MIKKYLKKIIKNYQHQPAEIRKGLNYSFSQCGEDRIVDYIFKLRNLEKPTYLDVGANDPYYLNNTAIFYERGCTGINVEANYRLIENFKVDRPNDINLNIGISSESGFLNFYIMEDNTLSTFSESEYEMMISHNKKLLEIKNIELTTISNLINKYSNGVFPDFFSLDVEGLDFEILKTINFEKSFPKIICVEASEYSSIGVGNKRVELIDFLVSKGYYEYANTNLNAIMVKNEFWFI